MNTIYKYEIPIEDEFSIQLPKNSEILSCQVQYRTPCIWAKVDTKQHLEKRYFRLIGTGHPINNNNLLFIDTIQLNGGALIFHLFEIVS